MDKIYLCKVAFVNLVERYNGLDGDTQYNEGIRKGIEESIRELAKALNIVIYFVSNKIDYDEIPL